MTCFDLSSSFQPTQPTEIYMTGIASGIRTAPNKTCTLGKLLWHDIQGERFLGFLVEDVIPKEGPRSLVIALIGERVVSVAKPEDCWPAEDHDARSFDLRKIVCTHPVWGVGIIHSMAYKEGKGIELLVKLQPRGEIQPTTKVMLSEVSLLIFSGY